MNASYIHGNSLIKSNYGWSVYDGHGSVVALTNSAGEVTKNYEYDEFGIQTSVDDGSDKNPFRYSGEYTDYESGYVYLRARYYSPELGRFVTQDPILDGYNWYAYCGNDPINNIDPSGLFSYKGAWNGAKKGWESGTGLGKVVQAGIGWFIGGHSGGKSSSSKKEETQTTTSSTTQGTTQSTAQGTTQSTTQTTTTPTKPLTPEQIEDYRMQDEIMNLLSSKYSKEAWEKAMDKEQFLRDLLSDCNSIMGTNVAGIEFIGLDGVTRGGIY